MLTDGAIKRVKTEISKQADKLDTIPVRRNGQAAAFGSPFLWPVASDGGTQFNAIAQLKDG
jgi:hypothetical protein